MAIRISGMASGMDIDLLVSDLMKAERIPLTKKTQKKTLIEYQMNLYRDVNSKLMTLRDNISKMRFGSDFTGIQAKSSNDSAVKVSGSNPSKVSTTIEVRSLATQATKQSVNKATTGAGLDLSKSLEENAGNFVTTPDVQSSDLEMTINGVAISYSKDDSIQSIMNKINDPATGVVLSYDSAADQFVFISRQTGEEAQIDAKDTNGNFLAAIQMDASVKKGVDAEVVINGIVSKRSKNSFTQDGVTYTLLQQTTSAVTVSNVSDTDAIVDKIKGFVNLYNEAISLVNKLTDEKRIRGYDPLTSDQKKEMSEDEVKEWEKIVKQGLLKNDTLLETYSRKMRSFLSQVVPGTELSPLDIGLGTTSFSGNAKDFSAAGGVIVLNEEKLREALEDNPEQVEALFTRSSTVDGEEGLFQKMYKQLNTTINEINKKSGKMGSSYNDVTTSLGKQTSNIEAEIRRMEDRLVRKENFYYQQFTAMEKAMNQSNSQLNFLLQNLGG